MMTTKGSFKIFRLFGINVYVHWMWVVFAVLTFQWRTHAYSSPIWNALEYLSLFAIVLIHEFGQRTGVPVVMNTSFNLRGEPIVSSPTDAIRTFFSSGMDALIIGSFVVEK